MKSRERKKTREEQMMYNCSAHHPLSDVKPIPQYQSALPIQIPQFI